MCACEPESAAPTEQHRQPPVAELDVTEHDTVPVQRRRVRPRSVLTLLLSMAVIAVVILLVRAAAPSPQAILDVVRNANGWWLVTAVALQAGSVWMLSVQQRRLMQALGTPVGSGRMAAITVASTAVSLTVPAGGVVGAGWSFRQYRLAGASRAAASTVTVVSGLAAAAGLATLVALLWTTFRTVRTIAPADHPTLVTIVVLLAQTTVLCAAWALWTWWRHRHSDNSPSPTSVGPSSPARTLRERIRHEIRAATRMTRSLGRAAWRDATAASVANRLLDAACLFTCCLALGIQVNFVELALVYLGIQLVRQIPLTPGGVGVVEVALLTGLTSIGVATASGAAVVVVYRLIAAWLLVPVGYAALLALRRRHPRAVPTTDRCHPATPPAGTASAEGEDEA